MDFSQRLFSAAYIKSIIQRENLSNVYKFTTILFLCGILPKDFSNKGRRWFLCLAPKHHRLSLIFLYKNTGKARAV